MLKLTIHDRRSVSDSRTILLEGSGTLGFGRASANDYVISSDRVARQHAEIRYEGGRAWLRDLRSTNGSLVNGELLLNGTERELAPGDRIEMDTVVIAVSSS